MIFDTIIIGLGPAATTSGIYLLRAKKKVLAIGKEFGGQIVEAPLIENFPAAEPQQGQEIFKKMFDQFESLGGKYVVDEVSKVFFIDKPEGRLFSVTTESGTFKAKSLIIATGSEHIKLNIENSDMFQYKNILYCALCDGLFHKGEDVIVLGSGNTGAQDAIQLSQYCKSITICEKGDHLRCDPILQERLKKNEKISFKFNMSAVRCIHDKENKFIGLEFNTGEVVKAGAVFVAIGQKPNAEFLRGIIDMDEKGYIIVSSEMETSCEGIFAAGDCIVKKNRQAVMAASDGAVAAITCSNYLNS